MDAMDMDAEIGNGVGGGGGMAPQHHEQQQQQQQQQYQPPAHELDSNVSGLLAMARQFVSEGKPSLALQAVVMAAKTKGGDGAVVQTLDRARDLYRNKFHANTAADELAKLFAECAIAELQPETKPTSFNAELTSIGPSANLDKDETSILAESGRKQIVLDFFLDGSSFVCLQCGGLVSNNRKDEHIAYWCS